MTSTFLYSQRLLFVASTPTLLQAELMSPHHLAQLLNVALPADWPPGEYDQDAMQFFLDQLQASGQAAVGWYGWYIICFPIGAVFPQLWWPVEAILVPQVQLVRWNLAIRYRQIGG